MIPLAAAGAVLKAAGARLGQISPKVWLALGCALALILGILWHRHEVKVTIATAKAEQKVVDDAAAKNLADHALAIKAEVDRLTANITTTLQEKNREDHARDAADAGALRLLGPGKAACPRNPVVSGAADRHVQAAPASNAPVAKVPPAGGQQLIALPFDDTISFGQSYDDLLADDKAMRAWADQVLKVWPKSAP